MFIDIGANLLDDCFQGRYNGGSQKHDPDLDAVLERASSAGVEKVGGGQHNSCEIQRGGVCYDQYIQVFLGICNGPLTGMNV